MSKEELLKIEKGFWSEGSDYYQKHISENAIFVFPGMRLGKEDGVSSADKAPRWDKIEFSNEDLFELSGNIVILTYHAKGQREGTDGYAGNIATIYRLENDEPKMVFHQHTPDPKN